MTKYGIPPRCFLLLAKATLKGVCCEISPIASGETEAALDVTPKQKDLVSPGHLGGRKKPTSSSSITSAGSLASTFTQGRGNAVKQQDAELQRP